MQANHAGSLVKAAGRTSSMMLLLHTAVLEVFSTWCGGCKSVLPMCKKIRIEKDDEAALTFLTVSACKMYGQVIRLMLLQ
jgi:thiol-disulfide isomerase/thioredoxin